MAKAKFIKKDKVMIIAGREKGKTGEVIKVNEKAGQITVAGLNIVKKAIKPTKKTPQGGIIEISKPFAISNVAFICPSCGKSTRVGIKTGIKKSAERFCKKCKTAVKE